MASTTTWTVEKQDGKTLQGPLVSQSDKGVVIGDKKKGDTFLPWGEVKRMTEEPLEH